MKAGDPYSANGWLLFRFCFVLIYSNACPSSPRPDCGTVRGPRSGPRLRLPRQPTTRPDVHPFLCWNETSLCPYLIVCRQWFIRYKWQITWHNLNRLLCLHRGPWYPLSDCEIISSIQKSAVWFYGRLRGRSIERLVGWLVGRGPLSVDSSHTWVYRGNICLLFRLLVQLVEIKRPRFIGNANGTAHRFNNFAGLNKSFFRF